MTFNEKMTMKDLLSEGLYILMQQKPFEKITIKQICDKTGVIRGTFYNHFVLSSRIRAYKKAMKRASTF